MWQLYRSTGSILKSAWFLTGILPAPNQIYQRRSFTSDRTCAERSSHEATSHVLHRRKAVTSADPNWLQGRSVQVKVHRQCTLLHPFTPYVQMEPLNYDNNIKVTPFISVVKYLDWLNLCFSLSVRYIKNFKTDFWSIFSFVLNFPYKIPCWRMNLFSMPYERSHAFW